MLIHLIHLKCLKVLKGTVKKNFYFFNLILLTYSLSPFKAYFTIRVAYVKMQKGVKALENSVCWRLLIISIFESGSRVIIAVRVASARSALATLASAKRG